MDRDYNYFFRRYNQLEADFLDMTDYIELSPDFNTLSESAKCSSLIKVA